VAGPPPSAASPAGPPRFEARWDPSDEALEAAWRLAGRPPLLAPASLRALAPPGARLLAVLAWRGDRLAAAAAGWEAGLPYARTLAFPALPAFAAPDDEEARAALWGGLGALARARRAPFLELSGLLGDAGAVPGSLGALRLLRWRRELLVDLAAWSGPPAAASGGDLALEVRRDEPALRAHRALLAGGPDAPEPGPAPPALDPAAQARLLRAGRLLVLRALRGEAVEASLLLAQGGPRAGLLGVAFTPGEAGLAAAAWLLRRAASHQAAAGATELSLGGVTETAPVEALGLRRPLASAERRTMHLVLVAGPRWPARLATAAELARRSPARLAAAALGRLAWRDRFVVHAWGPEQARAPEIPPGVEVRRLSDAEVVALASTSDAFSTHRHYVEHHGINGAWGLFEEGELAAVMWTFLRADHLRLPWAALRLGDGEAELGNGVTLPRAKGRGHCPLLVRALSASLFEAGVRRVYTLNRVANTASERCILKAGLGRVGELDCLHLPLLRRVRVDRTAIPGMTPAVEWIDLRRAFAGATGRAAG